MKPLYKKTKTGATQVWRVWCEGSAVVSEYGQLNGAMQQARYEAEPKNIGRSNETTAEEQAVLEAASLWQKQKDKKHYTENLEDISRFIIAPMLAKPLDKNLEFPVSIQPKLDGLRCMAYHKDGKVVLLSRGGKQYTAPKHIINTLEFPDDVIIDGELYRHGMDFQTLTSLAKREQEGTEKLELHAYDAISMNALGATWEEREELLYSLPIISVNTKVAHSYKDIENIHSLYLSQGYEGSIIRLHGYPYEFGKRSSGLLKYKNFMDEEFLVVDVITGKGKHKGSAIFVCKTDEGRLFNVTPEGTTAQRQAYYDKRFIGRWLTVEFFEYTNDGIPRFPVGRRFRDAHDLQ